MGDHGGLDRFQPLLNSAIEQGAPENAVMTRAIEIIQFIDDDGCEHTYYGCAGNDSLAPMLGMMDIAQAKLLAGTTVSEYNARDND